MSEGDIVKQFQAITNLNETDALNFLEASGWDIESATELFFSDQQSNQITPVPQHETQLKPVTQMPQGNQLQTQSQPKTTSIQKKAPSGGMMTLNDLSKQKEDENVDKYYAGGSVGSGVQIQDPTKRKNNVGEYVGDVFNKAQESGAKHSYEYEYEDDKPRFEGTGYTLGDTNYGSRSVYVPPTEKDFKATITFYKNGFVLNDGPLRSYDDPKNQSFLSDISHNEMPQELEQLSGGRNVETHLVDRKGEEYVPPKKVPTFEGEGHSLGSVSHQTISSTGDYVGDIVVDESKPVVTIQVKFHNGERKPLKLNKDHRIGDLCAWIEKEQGLSKNTKYELLVGVPPKPLTILGQTIEEAGIAGSMIVQRLC